MPVLTMPGEYKDTPIDAIVKELKPEHLAFANNYLNNNFNALDAYRTTYKECMDIKRLPSDRSAMAIQNNFAVRSKRLLKKAPVIAYILKTDEKRKAKAIEISERSYEAWITRMGELRDSAADQGQYSPSIRAHELIGKADGHIDANNGNAMSRIPDEVLIEQLVGILGIQAGTLRSVLNGGAPEAEVIELD